MEDNPYMVMVKRIREDILDLFPVSYRLGKVISVDPLKVEVASIIQTEESLLKNNALGVFETGERLLLTPIEEEQRYIIVCKVVDV